MNRKVISETVDSTFNITYIVLPLLLPFFLDQGVNITWLCMLVAMNLQTLFLTPSFGWSLFYLKGVAPPEVTTGDIYRGVLPYIGIQAIGLLLLYGVRHDFSFLKNVLTMDM